MKFDEFLQQASRLEGLVWRKYRRPPARRAVEERMAQVGLKTFDAYLELLGADPGEVAGLADLMHITVTRFFRDGECWKTLGQRVLPELCAETGEETLRVWSAGCCGGEEPYAVAMLWLDRAADRAGGSVEILASDIDEPSLERARAGCYDKASLREVPADVLERFFTRHRGRYCVTDPVRSLVRLERRNVMIDPLPLGMDLVLCRYLAFTYYRGSRLRAAAERLREALRPGGILMIGKKEGLAEEVRDLFEPIGDGEGPFFRRRD